MQFQPENLYHIYNRGNNRQAIFFNRKNYLFFLQKTRKHLIPFCDILCYCLMPNHFHFLVYTKNETVQSGQTTPSRPTAIFTATPTINPISRSIAILLSSYTRAIQKQQNITGSLFQQKTKAKALNSSDENYPFICFNYIHQNPMTAGLVSKMEDWEFSSFTDYIGLRKGSLIAKSLARQLLDLPHDKEEFRNISYQAINTNKLENIF